jgi:hypothetical protein
VAAAPLHIKAVLLAELEKCCTSLTFHCQLCLQTRTLAFLRTELPGKLCYVRARNLELLLRSLALCCLHLKTGSQLLGARHAFFFRLLQLSLAGRDGGLSSHGTLSSFLQVAF